MARYLILIYEPEAAAEPSGAAEVWRRSVEAHGRFAARASVLGAAILGGSALAPASTATSIRGGVESGGPFVRGPEALAGYYLLESGDPALALDIARSCPTSAGGVELRAVLDATGPDATGPEPPGLTG